MNQIGSYYVGMDYDTNYWRISLFPFSLCLSMSPMTGVNLELVIYRFKIFFGSKLDDKF